MVKYHPALEVLFGLQLIIFDVSTNVEFAFGRYGDGIIRSQYTLHHFYLFWQSQHLVG
jgi:hypothetical protein